MKRFLFLFTFIFFSFVALSQNFYGGLLIGISGSQIDGDVQAGYDKAGLLGGVFVGHPIAETWFADAEMYYIGKGAVNNIKYADGTVSQEFKTHLNYIEMPLTVRWQAFEKISVSGGIASAFLISAKIYRFQSLVDENQYTMQNFDFAPMAKFDFHFSRKFSINLRFSYSVFSIRKDFGWFNNNLSFALRYRLGQ